MSSYLSSKSNCLCSTPSFDSYSPQMHIPFEKQFTMQQVISHQKQLIQSHKPKDKVKEKISLRQFKKTKEEAKKSMNKEPRVHRYQSVPKKLPNAPIRSNICLQSMEVNFVQTRPVERLNVAINHHQSYRTPYHHQLTQHRIINPSKPNHNQTVIVENTQRSILKNVQVSTPYFNRHKAQTRYFKPQQISVKRSKFDSLIPQPVFQKQNSTYLASSVGNNETQSGLKSVQFTLSTNQSNEHIVIKQIDVVEEYEIKNEFHYQQPPSNLNFPEGFRKAQSLEDEEQEKEELSVVLSNYLIDHKHEGPRTDRKEGSLARSEKILETDRRSTGFGSNY